MTGAVPTAVPAEDLGTLHLRAVHDALRDDELSPAELLERCLDRVELALRFGAFVHVDEDGARRAVAQLDPNSRGPLYGVPCAVKDLVDVEGLPTGNGRRGGPVAREDAPVVRLLRQAGAIIVGKTRTDELGLGTFTLGARDPRDPMRTVGGSSGGSAIAVAVGAVALAVATDTAGSARIPAAACGVAGLCASVSGLPVGGTVQLSPDFDRIGLIATDGIDLEFAWRQLHGGSPARMQPVGPIFTLAPEALGHVDPDHLAAATAVAHRLGHDVVELPGPRFAEFGPDRGIVVTADAAHRHSRADAESPLAKRQLEIVSSLTPPLLVFHLC